MLKGYGRLLSGPRRVVLSAVVALSGVAHTAEAVVVGDDVSTIGIKHHAQGELNAASLKGKVTIVNFWATWCEACKVELVEMEDQLKSYIGGDQQLQVAFVSLDKEPEKAVAWFRDNLKDPTKLLGSLYVDPSFATADKLQIDSFPMTLVIGPDGKVVHVQRGFKEGEGSTQEIVRLSTELVKTAH